MSIYKLALGKPVLYAEGEEMNCFLLISFLDGVMVVTVMDRELHVLFSPQVNFSESWRSLGVVSGKSIWFSIKVKPRTPGGPVSSLSAYMPQILLSPHLYMIFPLKKTPSFSDVSSLAHD